MKLNYKNDIVWFLALSAVYFALTLVPILQNFAAAPADRFYYGAEEYPLDMTGNLANIREGFNGHWLRTSKFTSTITGPPTLMKFEYILIGQVGRLLRIDPLFMYYITKVLLSFAYLFLIFRIVRSVFSSTLERVTAYILIFFATGIRLPWQAQYMSIIDAMLQDSLPFVRLTTATHHYILGGIGALVSLFYLAETLKKTGKPRHFVIAAATIFLTSWVYAPDTILILLCVVVVCAVWVGRALGNPKIRASVRARCAVCFAYASIAIVPIVYIQLVINQVWDWNAYARTETLVPFEMNISRYLLGVGVVYFFALIGAAAAMRRKNLFLFFIAPFVLVHPFAEFILAPALHINRVRFFLSLYFIPYGILAAAGISTVTRWITQTQAYPVKRIIFTALLIAGILLPSAWAYDVTVKRQHVCFCMAPMFDYAYPKRDIFNTVRWLRDNSKEQDIVMSGYYAGALIPAFAGNEVLTSWWFRLTESPSLSAVVDPMVRFYRNSMSEAEAIAFMKQHHIAYVLYSDEEQALAPDQPLESYLWLPVAVRFGSTVLYKVML